MKFIPKMFLKYAQNIGVPSMITIEDATRVANSELQRHLEGLPVLLGNKNQYGLLEMSEYTNPEDGPEPEDTHTCKAWGITPIQPQKCEHVPEHQASNTLCKKCGVFLRACKWEAAEKEGEK